MSYFFLDDSKHPSSGFVLAAFVALPSDPAPEIARFLKLRGFVPFVDEFKSSHPMKGAKYHQSLRDDLRGLLNNCKLGVLVTRDEEGIPNCAAELLEKMLRYQKFQAAHHEIFLDRGLFPSQEDQLRMRAIQGASDCAFHFEVDSKLELGIQLADLAAHTCGIMMKDSLGLITKTIPAGENSGYDPDSQIESGLSNVGQSPV